MLCLNRYYHHFVAFVCQATQSGQQVSVTQSLTHSLTHSLTYLISPFNHTINQLTNRTNSRTHTYSLTNPTTHPLQAVSTAARFVSQRRLNSVCLAYLTAGDKLNVSNSPHNADNVRARRGGGAAGRTGFSRGLY